MPDDRPKTGYWDVPRDPLERAHDRLYSPNAETTFVEPSLLKDTAPDMTSGWQIPSAPLPEPLPPEPPKKPLSWTVLFFIGTAVFFTIAAGISFFFLAQGGRSVSSANITLGVQAPTSVASGTTVPLAITVLNHNPAAITDATMTINFPDGTRSSTDVTQALPQVTTTIGAVRAGGTVNRTVQAVLFGNTNQTLTVGVTLEYHTANSNTLFTKQQNYTFTITSSPLSITASALTDVTPGQPFTIDVAVRSNASTPLSNIAVSAMYPAGFSAPSAPVGSAQQGSPSAPITLLGTLTPGQERHFAITGTFSGSTNEQKNFDFTVGTLATGGTSMLSVVYASQSIGVTLTPPFLSTTLTLNHATDDPLVLPAGAQVAGLIPWTNSLSTAITNAAVSIVLSGNALDTSSVNTTNGYYNSSKNTIEFNSQTESSLAALTAGGTGTGAFSFAAKPKDSLLSLHNPTISLAVSVSGLTQQGQQTITRTLLRTIKIATDLTLASRVTRSNSPYRQTGPVPPIPNTPSTYTVALSVTNTVNSVGGAVATMILPSYVTYTSNENASTGALSYDQASHTVTWRIGDVPAGSYTHPLTAAFQVSFVPSSSQLGSSPVLVENQTLTGTDRFTNSQVGNVATALTIQTPSDVGYNPIAGTVGNSGN
jgi:hypothetical protein